MDKKLPFSFILDHLVNLDLRVKPMFGMFAIYEGQKIMMMLRQGDKNPERNGIWVAINTGYADNLKSQFPSLATIHGLPHKSEISEWLLLSSDAEDFESTAIRICELIVKKDHRIGHIPKSRRTG